MRTLAIGDIHGCSTALDLVLAAANPQPEDLIVTLGDYVDRGPDTKGVLERLIAMHKTGRLVALRGNHEWMMLDCRQRAGSEGWLMYGGLAALASYAPPDQPERRNLDDVPTEHWDFLENKLVSWHETETHFFVHASAYPDMPLAEQPDYMLLWEKFENLGPHMSGKIMVCGHTQQRTGEPLNVGHAICLDTWAYGNGWLTCMDVASGKVWQANQKCQQKTSWIHEYYIGD